jgi:hypothetical protein
MVRILASGFLGLALLLVPIGAQAQGVVYTDDGVPSDYRPGSHPVWTQTAAFSGTASRRTEPFTVTTAPWRARFTTFNRGTYLSVYDADTERSVATTYEHSMGEQTLSFLTPGRYYLRTYGTDTWIVTIEEMR